jgi:hypothetical protein
MRGCRRSHDEAFESPDWMTRPAVRCCYLRASRQPSVLPFDIPVPFHPRGIDMRILLIATFTAVLGAMTGCATEGGYSETSYSAPSYGRTEQQKSNDFYNNQQLSNGQGAYY